MFEPCCYLRIDPIWEKGENFAPIFAKNSDSYDEVEVFFPFKLSSVNIFPERIVITLGTLSSGPSRYKKANL